MIREKRGSAYGFNLSEEWQNLGLTSRRQPKNNHDLNLINAGLESLKKQGVLVAGQNNREMSPNGIPWSSENKGLIKKENSSLARFFRATGLKSTEAAWQTKLSAEEFEAAGDSLNEGLDGQPSISLLLEHSPVAQAQSRMIEDNEPT